MSYMGSGAFYGGSCAFYMGSSAFYGGSSASYMVFSASYGGTSAPYGRFSAFYIRSSASYEGSSASYMVLLSWRLRWSLLVSTGRISKIDWVEWLCQLGVKLLKESPSPTLRSCWALAQVYKSLPQ